MAYPTAEHFSGYDPDIIKRFPNVPPARRAQLAWLQALYALDLTMPEVAEITGYAVKTLQNIRTSYGITSSSAARNAARQRAAETRHAEQSERDAKRLREYIELNNCTVAEAGRCCGIGKHRAKEIARRFGIQAPWRAIAAARNATNAARAEKARTSKPAPPNPYRTAAQQQQIREAKRDMWTVHGAKVFVPPPANADALIAEALAAGRVTHCPPRAVLPVQNGLGFA